MAHGHTGGYTAGTVLADDARFFPTDTRLADDVLDHGLLHEQAQKLVRT